jgi:signal transduction histidine kinase
METLQESVQVLPQPTSLNRVVLDLMDLYQPAFAQKRLGSGLDLDPTLPLAWIDAPQLGRGLASILRNALKYTRDGDLIVCRTNSDGDWIQLTIGDSGPSIDPEKASGLFGRDLDGVAATDEPRGGLGLAVSQAVVAAHGGEIVVDTSRESGAWFVVRLPVLALQNAWLVAELERGSHEKYDLIATLSYELRAPLNVIIGYNDLLRDGGFGAMTEEQQEVLSWVDGGTRELLDLISATLDISRLMQGAASVDQGDSTRPPSLTPCVVETRQGEGRRVIARRPVELGSLALENARLVEQLRETRQAESEFVTTTSHELRVPLNAIIGYLDLLLDQEFGTLTREQEPVVGRIRNSALQLLESINTNLHLRQLSGGAIGSA